MDDVVAIAQLLRPRGLKGELIANLLTDFPERFEGLENVTAVLPDATQLDLKIEKFWFQNGRIVLKFAGFDTIEKAEELRNAEICIPDSEVVELNADEYFDWELTDCQVTTIDGREIGKVRELMRTGGTELLVVQGDEKEFLIPFAEAICTDVDIENKLIRVDPPDGLLDF